MEDSRINIVHEHQMTNTGQKDLIELTDLSTQELQQINFNLNPHELMEQIHFILKVRIIKYSVGEQRQRKYDQKETEMQIKALNEELQAGNHNNKEQRELIRNLTEKESKLEKMEEHQAKGNSVRA